VHHRDTGVERVPRRVELDRLAPQPDLPAVRTVEAGEDVRQRRLAGAVLAEQRVDLAGGRLEVDVLVGDDGGEALGDPPQGDCGRWRGGLRLPAGTISPWRYRSHL
jgi:hypothetical protein